MTPSSKRHWTVCTPTTWKRASGTPSTSTAADYAFQGVPSEVDSGVTSFEFKNGGTEVHEMVVFRINDGVTETVDELLAMPEEEVVTKTTMVPRPVLSPERTSTRSPT